MKTKQGTEIVSGMTLLIESPRGALTYQWDVDYVEHGNIFFVGGAVLHAATTEFKLTEVTL